MLLHRSLSMSPTDAFVRLENPSLTQSPMVGEINAVVRVNLEWHWF